MATLNELREEEMRSLIDRIAVKRTAEILAGKITNQMIEQAAAADRFRYMGVPVTEGQFDALMKAAGFETGRVIK